MFGIPVGLLIRIGIALAVAAVLAFAWHALTNHYREQGRVEVRAEWELDKARRIQATTDQVLAWDAERQKREKLQEDLDRERAKQKAAILVRVAKLDPAVRGTVFPGVAVRLLNDAISNTTAVTGASREPAKEAAGPAADSTVGLLTEWGVQCISLYDEARGMVEGWQQFYQSLRAAQ